MVAFRRGSREEEFQNLSPALRNFYRMQQPRKNMLKAAGGVPGIALVTESGENILTEDAQLMLVGIDSIVQSPILLVAEDGVNLITTEDTQGLQTLLTA